MARKSIHSVLPLAAIVLGVPFVLAVGYYAYVQTRPYDVPVGRTVFDVAQGDWKWSNNDSTCRQAYHTISFSPDRKQMFYTTNKKIAAATGTDDSVFTYDVISYDRHSIHAFMHGETRRGTDGKLVLWDLILKSPDTYVWHEADWPKLGSTAEIRRCKAGEL